MKTHIEINKANLLHNLKVFKEITQKKIMFVVKANAYGHGLSEIIEISKELPYVDYYAVDSVSEALLIKSRQQKKPVLILGWSDPAELAELIANGFETVIPSFEQLQLSRE
jgi:alanine racemase